MDEYKYFVMPVNLKHGELYRVRRFRDEKELISFLRAVKPSDYIIVEGQELKAKKTEVIELISINTKAEEE